MEGSVGPDSSGSPEGADSTVVSDSTEGWDGCDGPPLVLMVLQILMILMALKVHEGPECS